MKRLLIFTGALCCLFFISSCDRFPENDEPVANPLVEAIKLNLNPLRANAYQLIHLEHNKKRPYVLLTKIKAEAYNVDTCKLTSMTFRVQSLRKNKNYYYVRSVIPEVEEGIINFHIEIDRVKNITEEFVEMTNTSGNDMTCSPNNPCEITVPLNGMKIYNEMLVDYHISNTEDLNKFMSEYKVSDLTIEDTERANFCCGAICKTYFTF